MIRENELLPNHLELQPKYFDSKQTFTVTNIISCKVQVGLDPEPALREQTSDVTKHALRWSPPGETGGAKAIPETTTGEPWTTRRLTLATPGGRKACPEQNEMAGCCHGSLLLSNLFTLTNTIISQPRNSIYVNVMNSTVSLLQ